MAEGVDNTMNFIATHSGSGSSVIFDYFTNEFLSDTSRPEVKSLRRTMQTIGEEYTFGINEGQVAPPMRFTLAKLLEFLHPLDFCSKFKCQVRADFNHGAFFDRSPPCWYQA